MPRPYGLWSSFDPQEGHTPRERSACGWRDRRISHEDAPLSPAAWAHAVEIDGARLRYHKRSTELYYVLEGSGSVVLDGVNRRCQKVPWYTSHLVSSMEQRVSCGVLVVGIPDIAEDDYFEVGQPLMFDSRQPSPHD